MKFNITLLDEKDINLAKLQESIRIACLEEFVDDLPMGLNSKIGNVGLQISGGQKQGILIARAIYKDYKESNTLQSQRIFQEQDGSSYSTQVKYGKKRRSDNCTGIRENYRKRQS